MLIKSRPKATCEEHSYGELERMRPNVERRRHWFFTRVIYRTVTISAQVAGVQGREREREAGGLHAGGEMRDNLGGTTSVVGLLYPFRDSPAVVMPWWYSRYCHTAVHTLGPAFDLVQRQNTGTRKLSSYYYVGLYMTMSQIQQVPQRENQAGRPLRPPN
jgi:hypothetical protein